PPTEIYALSLHDALPIFDDLAGSRPSFHRKNHMLKQDAANYQVFRKAGIRLNEEMLPHLAKVMAGRSNILLPAIHAFDQAHVVIDRKSTRLNSSHVKISY